MLKLSSKFIRTFNQWTVQKKAFVFLIDFEGKKPVLFLKNEAAKHGLFFSTPKANNLGIKQFKISEKLDLVVQPVSYKKYLKAFLQVQKHLKKGDTYLLNLTAKSLLQNQIDLRQIFYYAQAPYRILWQNQFVCFSPESFIQIEGNKVYTFPMKGTIDADIPQSATRLLQNSKENFEHHTIVDLLRNDLAIIATNIKVNRFKYLQKIHTTKGNIWQMSSEIEGDLPQNWQESAAQMIAQILPAGSISGAPKTKTISIIQNIEQENRGYYTGVFGYFDGEGFDTAVLIRYIEKDKNAYYYRSGGGITALSEVEDEYNELIKKIYVPIN